MQLKLSKNNSPEKNQLDELANFFFLPGDTRQNHANPRGVTLMLIFLHINQFLIRFMRWMGGSLRHAVAPAETHHCFMFPW